MKINQIYSLLNDINKQMWGQEALDVHDLSGIISLGDTVLSSTDNMDKFFGKLYDRIGKTVIRRLDLELDFPGLYMDSFEFGAAIQKITVNPFEAINNAEWQVGENGFTPTFADIHKADIVVTYFTGASTFKFQRTIPDDLFATAFTSESAMGNFIDAIIQAMTDSMTIAINNLSRTAINEFIAEKIKYDNGVINLLEGYNALLGSGNEITAAAAIYDAGFLKYATNTIRRYMKYLNEPSVLYNLGSSNGDGTYTPVLRATSRDNMHVIFNSYFTAAVESYLESDAFHNEFVKLPLYTEVGYWQSNNDGTDINSFEINTAISVTPSSEAGAQSPTNVEATGVIGVLADRQAVFVGLNKMRSGAFRNDIDAYTNVSTSATKQYCVDLSENGIVFIVADASDGE